MPTSSSKGKDFIEIDSDTMPPPVFPVSDEESDSKLEANSETISTFDNFSLKIDELLKDYELPRPIKWNYYKLCCFQNSLLHENLPKWMNHILVGGSIIEIVTIADALRQCDFTTSKEEFAIWNKTLKALEILGMRVGFLCAHLQSLEAIVLDPNLENCRKNHAELCSENARTEGAIKSLMAKLVELRKVHSERAVHIEMLKMKIEDYKMKFQERVDAFR